MIRPYSKTITQSGWSALSSGKKILVKFFTNSSIKKTDKVRTQYSTHLRSENFYRPKKVPTEQKETFQESYTHEEEQLLKKVMLGH